MFTSRFTSDLVFVRCFFPSRYTTSTLMICLIGFKFKLYSRCFMMFIWN